jgi:hypothetical protein
MGMDIWSGDGIVTDVETLVNIISDKNKEAVVKTILEWVSGLTLSTVEKQDGQVNDKGSIFKGLADDITVDDLKAKLIAQCEVDGEASGDLDYGNCYLVHVEDDCLCTLWDAISEVSGTDLPGIAEVRVFDSYLKHAECPIGEVSFIFSRDDIYESKLNDKGEALQKLCGGNLNEVTWTDVSY